MTLENTERPLHVRKYDQVPPEVECDYFDVSLLEGDQPRYRLQPHADGGTPIGPGLILESEGARARVQHLEKVLRDPTAE
jgi:hypothetical protein